MAKLSRIARPQTRFMQSNEIGEVAAEENAYGFNHAVRGYDPEEVDDYINNLFGNYKNTQNVLNKQKEEFETEREMLQCEINDLHGKNGALQEENDELKATIEELREEILALAEGAGDSQQSVAPAAPVEKPSTDDGSAEYEVLYAENNELIGKNRTLSIENAKLQKSVATSAMEAKEATDKLGEIQSRLDESENKLADNQNKLEECQAQLEDSQVQLLETQEKVEEGQTRIQSMEEEMTKMRKKMEIVDSKELIDSLISSMGSLESVLKQRQE